MLVMSSVKNEVDYWKMCLNFPSLCLVTGIHIKYAINITCVSLTILWWSLLVLFGVVCHLMDSRKGTE